MSALLDFFARRREAGASLVLATVIDTQGSTYSKSGERLLIDGDGIYRGLLTGGCLEGDLAIRARQVLETGEAALVDYDFSDDDDELWGMGAGCDGQLHVLLQALTPTNNWQPFASIADVLESDDDAVVATLVQPGRSASLGAAALYQGEAVTELGLAAPSSLADAVHAVAEVRRSAMSHVELDGEQLDVHLAYVEPPPRFLVLGAGPDVGPLLDIAGVMGWRCTVYDHRPAYISAMTKDVETICAPAAELLQHVDIDRYDRAMVMSHHLSTDREYLRQLAGSRLNYIGLLGPPSRKQRLMDELGDDSHRLAHRVRGPAGLNFGGRGPSIIALSIVAEIQQLLH